MPDSSSVLGYSRFSSSAAGIVTRGHGVASGVARDERFPGGTIALQLPFLRNAIPDFDSHLNGPLYLGTVNILFAARSVRLVHPDVIVPAVRWTDRFPPENFLLSRCVLRFRAVDYPAWIYLPDPATKPDHIQSPSIAETLCSEIPALNYGSQVELLTAPGTLEFGPAIIHD